MKTPKKKTGIKLKKTKGKRVSLRCPLSVERTDLEYNFDQEIIQVCMTVENVGGGGLASDTIESAVIVVRLFEKGGKLIPCGENDYFAKLLKFGEAGLESGERSSFRLTPDCGGADARVEDVEVYISRIRYTDNTVTDYVRGDFFDFPGDGILLTKKFKKNAAEATAKLGNGATYLPEHLTEIVWRCTCGEFSESDTCPNCQKSKAELFAALDELTVGKSAPIPTVTAVATATDPVQKPQENGSAGVGDNTAEYSISTTLAAKETQNTDAEDADEEEFDDEFDNENTALPPVASKQNPESPDKVKVILLTAISAAAVILLTIIILLILTLCSDRTPADTTTSATTTTTTTEPAAPDYNESIVRKYMAGNDYRSALGYAMQAGCSQTLIDEIYTTAIDYYIAAGDLTNALEWATLKGDTAISASIHLQLFSQLLNEGKFEDAIIMADKLPAEQQASAKAQAAEGLVQNLLKDGKYSEAMETAKQYNTATTAEQIAESAINRALDAKEFDTAIDLAKEFNLPSQVIAVAMAATDHYKNLGNYNRAADYVVLTGNTARMQEILSGMSEREIRSHLPAFFPLLSFERMQAVHSSPMSTKPQAIAAIDAEGNVFLGGQMIYSQEDTGIAAVSVSCCDTAVVILLADGTVKIAEGSNSSYSAEDIEDWDDVVAIAAGNFHLLALTKDGKVLATGKNDDGQCNTEAISNAVAIAVGFDHSLILLSDGTVIALGRNIKNICDTQNWTDIVAIAAGFMHSIGLKKDGTVVALGNCDVDDWKGVTAIFSYSYATTAIALKSDGTLLCTIEGNPSEMVSAVQNVLWVSVGNNKTVVVLHKDGTLSSYGQFKPDAGELAGIPLKTDVFGMN